jgi:predicted transposase
MIKTIKLPINLSNKEKEIVLRFQKNQNNVIRFTYNRLKENKDLLTKEIGQLHKSLNNITIDTHFLTSAVFKAKELSKKEKVIFGGKSLFIDRCQNKVTQEEFQLKKLLPLLSIGETDRKANRKFNILVNNKILFKPNKYIHLKIQLPHLRKNLQKEINALFLLQENKEIPITYQLSTEYIYLSFEDSKINEIKNYNPKENRIMSIDLNPNYIGYSVLQWIKNEYKIIDKGVFDLSYFSIKSRELKKLKYELKELELNGNERIKIIQKEIKKLNDKRNFETIEIAKQLFGIFRSFNCKVFGIEDLNIKSKDNQKGKNYNRLVNNEWLRTCLVVQLKKRIDRLKNCRLLEMSPEYSSFIGNLLYREENLPDMILSSIEINRRTYEFYNQYILKIKKVEKSVLFPVFKKVKESLAKSLEEFSLKVDNFDSWISLYRFFKNSKLRYRVPLEIKGFSKNCIKKKVYLYAFY